MTESLTKLAKENPGELIEAICNVKLQDWQRDIVNKLVTKVQEDLKNGGDGMIRARARRAPRIRMTSI